MINLNNFNSTLLKIDKKSYKEIDIYYMRYITIKKVCGCKNIHSVNPLYLVINSATGNFKEKNDGKYLILDSTDKYEEVWSGTRSETKALEKNYFMKKTTPELELTQMMICL